MDKMDRVKAQHKAGVRLLANRYMLNECLFASTLGTLYQARDTQSGSESDKLQVLIHLIPMQALGYTPLKIACTRLQQLVQRSNNPHILPITDCGWMGTDAYFVLEAPQSWSLSTLPAPQNSGLTHLHESAIHLTKQLIDQGLVREGLQAQLFLVTPDGQVHLPGTTLSANLQALQNRNKSLLSPALQTIRKQKHWLYSKVFWLGSTSIALAGGLSFYYTQQLTERYDSRLANSLSIRLPPSSSQPLVVATKLASDTPEQTILALAPNAIEPIPKPESTPEPIPEPIPEPVAPPRIPDHLGQELIESIEQTQPTLNRFPPELVASLSATTSEPEPIPETIPESEPVLALISVPEEISEPEPEPNPEPSTVPEPTLATIAEIDTPVAQAHPQVPPTPAHILSTESAMPEPVSPNIARNDSVPFVPVSPHQPQPIVRHTQPAPPTPLVVQPAPRPVQSPTQPIKLTPTSPPLANTHLATPDPVSNTPDYADSPELTANGMTSAQLVQRAYAAIRLGKLDERASHGAIYFIRLLHRIDRGNPQIQRLAREVAYKYHQQARNAIGQQEFNLAERDLRMAERVIKEFNLVKLNPAQAVLEHKLAGE